MKTLIWGDCTRPWGREVRVDYTAPDGRVIHYVIYPPTKADQKQIDTMAAALLPRVQIELQPAPVKTIDDCVIEAKREWEKLGYTEEVIAEAVKRKIPSVTVIAADEKPIEIVRVK